MIPAVSVRSSPPVDASSFTGGRFTLAGDLGTCSLSFSAVPSEGNAVANGPVGTCMASACNSPTFGLPCAANLTIRSIAFATQ